MTFFKIHHSSWIVLGLVFVAFFISSHGHQYGRKTNLQVIHKRSHLLMRSVIDGMLQKAELNTSVFSNYVSRKVNDANFLRVCYYMFDNPMPEKLNASLCTHIILGFASVRNGSLIPSRSKDEKGYILTTNLKKQYPDLKVMLSCGGGGNDKGFSEAVNSFKNRTKFIKSSIALLRKYNFDGLDVDWEFPAWQGAPPEDKPNLVLFLKEFQSSAASLIQYSQNPLLLSVAVGAPKPIVDVSYDIPEMAKYVDFINLMSYDYHDYSWYLPFTGHNSPLFNRSVEHAYFATLNTAWSANYWFQKGMPMSKIMVGIPTYAHTYTLADSTLHGFDDPATGYGIGNGTMTFPMVCSFLANGTRVFDKESQVPYAYGDLNWIAYDDYNSVKAKAQWVRSQGFGGVMTFDLNCDDWQGLVILTLALVCGYLNSVANERHHQSDDGTKRYSMQAFAEGILETGCKMPYIRLICWREDQPDGKFPVEEVKFSDAIVGSFFFACFFFFLMWLARPLPNLHLNCALFAQCRKRKRPQDAAQTPLRTSNRETGDRL